MQPVHPVRPVIQDSPAEVLPGTEFIMHVDNPASIKTLALMPFGAVTHSFDMSARRLELPFTVQADGSLKVDLPANSNLLTPGYWMLFAINDNGTPSIASTVQVGTELLYDLPAQLPLDLLDANMTLQRNDDAAYDAYNDRYVATPAAPPSIKQEASYRRSGSISARRSTFHSKSTWRAARTSAAMASASSSRTTRPILRSVRPAATGA